MKKMVITAFCLVLAVPLMVTAQETPSFTIPARETSRSTALEFNNTFEHGNNAVSDSDSSSFGSPGIGWEEYSFRNGRNFGEFSHWSFAVPLVGYDGDTPFYDFQWSGLSGPAFRIRFTDRLTLHAGLGLSVNGLHVWYNEGDTDYFMFKLNFGAGADAGLKIDITDTFFIKGGVNVMQSFLGITNVRENSISYRGWGETSKNPKDYWTLNVNPYISFGVNLYTPKRSIEWPVYERPRYGKPPREEDI
ncbi:hypothetical protein FACS189444_0340 [Spirochaetia bacterium]|nr:hypothetical protein FACS189444_0340 [Spirochaetia bacterium]